MDICTTSTPHRHFHHHISNGSIHVMLHFKFQLYLVVTSTVMKRRSDKHTKTLSWFDNTKVYSLLHLLEVNKKGKTAYEKWVDHFS